MRNLILMHLESLNYTNYRVNQRFFPCLSSWEKKSLSFSRYFSTATSTLMVIGDLVYGGMLQYEICDSMDSLPEKYCYKESVFDQLNKRGYETKALYYPDGVDCKSAERRHIVGFQCNMQLIQEHEKYMCEIERTMTSGRPFALLLCNTISNVSLNHHIPDGEFESGLDRWKNGYIFMDQCVNDVITLLESKKLLDNTTIIFYGDHGDDYFGHGNHEGLTHAIEPYASLIHTPFWIYDNRLVECESCDTLIDTTDIKYIIERLLDMPDERVYWKNIDISYRKYTLARNVYAAQPIRSGSFNKGYSLTDGKFLFLVSNNGMELYDIEMDMQCQNNLLKFFVYTKGILHLNEELNCLMKNHYRTLMNMGSIRQIRQTFYFFRKKLYDEVMELFHYAECGERIEEINFEKIHYI